MRKLRKTALVELLPIQTAVKISACCDGSRQHDATSVDGLEDTGEVAAACDFLDEFRGQSLGAQLLVNAHEVDLGAIEEVFANAKLDGYARDESDQLLGFASSHANVPFFPPAGCFERPIQE